MTVLFAQVDVCVGLCVFHQEKREKRGVLKEITPPCLGVLVTHALVVVEPFPHLHSEVRDAALAAPPVSTCPSRALLNHNLTLKKQQGKKTRNPVPIKTTSEQQCQYNTKV